jgi:single-strand DNA-binding protein
LQDTKGVYTVFQKTIIAGNLGGDPELRYTPTGEAVTNFSVAVNRKWTGADGQPAEETTWFRVSVWGRQAESCNQYLSKGSAVLIEGTLTPDRATGGPRMWTAQDGTVRTSFELRAFRVQFLSGGQQTQTPAGDGQGQAAAPDNIAEDEIPF